METKYIILIVVVAAILLAVIAGLSNTNQENTTTQTNPIVDSDIEKIFTMPMGFL